MLWIKEEALKPSKSQTVAFFLIVEFWETLAVTLAVELSITVAFKVLLTWSLLLIAAGILADLIGVLAKDSRYASFFSEVSFGISLSD